VTKRVTVVAAISLIAVLAVPSVAFAQDEGSSGEPSTTDGTAGSVQETQATPPEPVTPDPPVVSEQTEQVEDTSGTTEEPETDPIEPQVASSDAGSAVDTSSAEVATPAASTSQATVTGKGKLVTKLSTKNRKGKKAKGSCATSSRGGGQLAQASAPVAPGCTRLNGPNGVFQAPDGTTLTVTETDQGVITVTVSGAPGGAYSGTLFVKGGPSDPGNPCVFNAVPNGASQVCTAPINPNNGKFFGVSHVDACPPGVTPTVTPGTPGDTGRQRREEEQERERERRKRAAREAASAPVAATAVAAPGGQLPVTGLPVAWLVLVGGGLLVSGFAIRRMA
jgi:hypothetical protein